MSAVDQQSRKCKCCGSEVVFFGSVDFVKNCEEVRGVFLKPSGQQVPYFRCLNCRFLFTDLFDDWAIERYRAEIYNDGYSLVDPDFAERRPSANAALLLRLFGPHRDSLTLLDYGGGNGRLVELLLANGFRQAFSYDPLYDEGRKPPTGKFRLVTAFEVVEHMPDPLAGFGDIIRYLRDDGLLLFSTLLQPRDLDRQGLRWWYAAPRNGHISLHSAESLALLAHRHGMAFRSLTDDLHVACRQYPGFASHLISAQTAIAP
jgi:2-polyprenyl-6-hydroxyphenyl methylase/3-demethylubiquinone-9 3-methyltransferase